MGLVENKISLVTASTRGIGLACAKKLAENGSKVYLAVRRIDAGNEVAQEIIANGGKADVVYFNARENQTFSEMIDEVVEREGRIDILVNNYGATDVNVDNDVLNSDFDSFIDIVSNNLRSVYVPCQEAIKCMIKNGGGSIVNISSVGSVSPDVTRTAYGVAKAAINSLTKNIATQYARAGIRCNAVLPGYIETEAASQNMSGEFLNSFLKAVPLGRAGQVEDIANAVLFLASRNSSFITGECLTVAGGFGMPTPMYPIYMDMSKNG